jgi:hypothetical protein
VTDCVDIDDAVTEACHTRPSQSHQPPARVTHTHLDTSPPRSGWLCTAHSCVCVCAPKAHPIDGPTPIQTLRYNKSPHPAPPSLTLPRPETPSPPCSTLPRPDPPDSH